jgi:hypothetical protein
MKIFKVNVLLLSLLLLVSISNSYAEDVSKEQLKGLDEQVQDIKKDVLSISADLTQLEEKLLYPSNTQVSIFVSFDADTKLPLNAVKIKIDGKETTSHIYTYKELEALQSGGVQRLYTGNIRSGEHTLDVIAMTKSSADSANSQSASLKFSKSVEPKLIEIKLSGSGSGNQHIGFKD